MTHLPDQTPRRLPQSRRRRLVRVAAWRARVRVRNAWRETLAFGRRVRRAAVRALPFAATAVATLVFVAAYSWSQPKPHQLDQNDVNRSVASALASITPAPALSSQVYAAVAPSLVRISVEVPGSGIPQASQAPGASPAASAEPGSGGQPNPLPSGKSTAFGTPAGTGIGSGVVADDQGDILTALHVVSNATSIQVTFADGSTSPAQIATRDAAHDIAVLQPAHPPATIVPAVLGNPSSVRIGNEAFVMGNPFGLHNSLSAGVVSGLGRSYRMADGTTLTGLIQVDAAVNPGNSGGPLVDRNGQVVGIVTALINPTDQNVFIGIGLAVPIDVAASGGLGQLPQY